MQKTDKKRIKVAVLRRFLTSLLGVNLQDRIPHCVCLFVVYVTTLLATEDYIA
jgi:hypothetical protein